MPFLTALAPSERCCRERGRPHKKLTDWGRQLAPQARRWLPGRELVVVGDSAFAALELLAALSRHGVACITRLRLDATLYDPPPPRLPGRNGRPRTKGKRLANLSEVLINPATAWQRVTVPGWYGGGERNIEISTNTAVWRHGGMPVVPIRWAKQPKIPRAQQVEWQRRVSSATLQASSTHKPCSAPTRPRTPFRSCAGSFSAGRPRPRSVRCATTLAWKPSASGRTKLLPVQRPACSACSPWSPCWDSNSPPPPGAPGCRSQRLVSQAAANLLRHARSRAPGNLARTRFRHVPQRAQHAETPATAPGRHHLRTLPRRMMAKVQLREAKSRLIVSYAYTDHLQPTSS